MLRVARYSARAPVAEGRLRYDAERAEVELVREGRASEGERARGSPRAVGGVRAAGSGPGRVQRLVRLACSYLTGRVYSNSYECFLSSILIDILPVRPVN